MKSEEDVLRIIQYMNDPQVLEDLRYVRELKLPQGCIAAGYVRNRVWDKLHGYTTATPLNDIDVIYFDPKNTLEERDEFLEQSLNRKQAGRNWSVKNQARMHIRNGEAPYSSIEDAMSRWPETATAVAIRLNAKDQMEVICPHGLEDLLDMRVRQSPLFRHTTAFRQRVFEKQWLDNWPLLIVENKSVISFQIVRRDD